jgi:hypothetical protein
MASEMPEIKSDDYLDVWRFLESIAQCFDVHAGQLRATDRFAGSLAGGDVELDVERFVLEEEVIPAVLPPEIVAEFIRKQPASIRDAIFLIAAH